MNVQIRRIGPDGLDLKESFPVELIGQTQSDAVQFISPFEVEAKIVRIDNEVIAGVAVKSHYESFCSRCLEELKQDWTTKFTLTFDTKEYTEFIEMDEDIRQELVLNLPVRILCREDCKGLCIDCGANLNKKECQHKHAVPVVSHKS
jgi:uncharacterized protein